MAIKLRNFKTETFEEAVAYDKHSDQQYNCGLHLIKELGIRQGSTVLDVGAGTGRLALHAAGLIGKDGLYFGIDLSPERINIAKKKAKDLQASNLFFEIGDGTDLRRFEDGFFDVVYMNSVFHWIKDKKILLHECHRVLKQGGHLGFTSKVKNLPRNGAREIAKAILKKKGYNITSNHNNYPVTVYEVRKLLELTGFLVQNIEVRQTIDNFASAKDAVNSIMNRAPHRNFLRDVPKKQHPKIRNELISELKKIETEEGINFVRNKIYAIAEKRGK
ncbi:MAG: methyltransferase domain-containing protein [Candidatus Methanoperedens sp.]